jgi:hypothetical protein
MGMVTVPVDAFPDENANPSAVGAPTATVDGATVSVLGEGPLAEADTTPTPATSIPLSSDAAARAGPTRLAMILRTGFISGFDPF